MKPTTIAILQFLAVSLAAGSAIALTADPAPTPADWNTSSGFVIPPCGTTATDGNMIHFEVAVAPRDPTGIANAYSAFRAQGYHNLAYRLSTDATMGIFGADCSFGN